MSSNNMPNLTEIILEILKAMQRAFQKLFSLSTENNLKETEEIDEISPASSTKQLSSLFRHQKKKQKKEDDDGSSGETGLTWFDDIARNLYQNINEEEIGKLMEEVEKDPDKKRKFQKYLKKRKGDSLAKKIRTVLELKLKQKKHLKYKKAQLKYKKAQQAKSVNKIITTASKKLHKRLNKKEKKLAVEYFKNNYQEKFSPVQLANIALLGVISVHFTGGIRPVIQVNWGNPFGITDYNAYDGDATIDQAKRIDYTFGDPLGFEAQAVITLLKEGAVLPKTKQLLKENGVDIDELIHQPTSQEKKSPKLRMG